MKKASVVVLGLLGAVMLLVSFLSANLAYRGDYPIGAGLTPVAQVAGERPEVLSGLRGIRGTSAAYAGAYALLFLAIVFGPYRRGEVWAWWALLASLVLLAGIIWLRVPALGSSFGAGASALQLGLGVLGLLLDVGRLRR
jgi:hypothetical protein